ncbi:MAG: hypothetical protein WCR46_24390 [Deltaproteobacteria bacterium]
MAINYTERNSLCLPFRNSHEKKRPYLFRGRQENTGIHRYSPATIFTNHYMRYHSVKPNSSEKAQLPHASDQTTIDRTIEVLFSILVVIAPLLYYPHIVNFSNLPKTLVIQSGLCAIFLLWIIRWMTCFRVKIFIHPVFTWVWMWLLWSGITILWSVDKFSGFNTWLHWVICALGMNVLISPAPSLEKIDRIILVSCLGAGMVSFIGILLYVCGIDLIPQSQLYCELA